MKTRIISGVVMGAIVALALALGLYVENLILTCFVAIVAALGVFELVGNAAKINNIIFRVLSAVYTVGMVFIFCTVNENLYRLNVTNYEYLDISAFIWAIMITVIYVIVTAILILVKHEEFDLAKISVICAMPFLYAFAFSSIASIIIATGKIYYLLLVLNFACVCDMGAYFVGISIGKTKLCPQISPKKTVEGALGGIVSSMIITVVITLCYGYFDKVLPTLLITIPLCVVGMTGDLFASIIKRKVGIKDYGDLIPGHGGILDRVDSILFICPLVYCLMLVGVI
ncbi:MAG: phosphatidate cytidylyltransferase [Clostridia bacterium]|nr:phosphatidate cytidylyltransferase [Clostridia bacterium]